MSDKKGTGADGELFQTHIGGAAMLEGVMMRGKYSWAVAVREPDGSIYVEEHDVPGYGKKQQWRRWPLVRGCVSLVESLILQFKAMGITAAHAYDFEEDDPKESARIAQMSAEDQERARAEMEAQLAAEKEAATKEAEEKGLSGWMMVSMVVGVVLGVALFVLAPAGITNLVIGDYTRENMLAWNLVDGILRAGVFILYMWLIGFMPDIKRMFSYHGAEHKTIHCLEHGLPLTPENCRSFSRQHVRCGTAFIIMTLLISIIVFTVFPTDLVAESLGLQGGPGRFAVVVLSRLDPAAGGGRGCLRGHGTLGREPSRQPAGQGGAGAGHGHAAHHHQRARRLHARVRHCLDEGRGGPRGPRGGSRARRERAAGRPEGA